MSASREQLDLLKRQQDHIQVKLRNIQDEQKRLDEHIRGFDRQIRLELKKTTKHASFESISESLKNLERRRSTMSMSLAEEKRLLKEMDKLKSDRRLLEHVESIKRQKEGVLKKKEELSRLVLGNRLMRKEIDDSIHNVELVERISKKKGSVVTPNMLYERIEAIPKDRIGQFVGKMGVNLNKLQEKYFVSIDVSNDGFVTIYGVQEDVEKACVAIGEFRTEITETMALTTWQQKMLKGNKGSHLKNLEALLGVNLLIVAGDGPGESSVLRMRGSAHMLPKVRQAVNELAAKTDCIQVVSHGMFLRSLFAQGGAELHKLEQLYNVGLDVDRDKGTIYVTGSVAQVELACNKLRAMAASNEEEVVEIELETADLVSVIIGKKGQTVRRIQAETGAHISIRKPDNAYQSTQKPVVVIKGQRMKVAAGRSAIDAILRQHAKENVILRFPEIFHSALYGQGGAVIKQIQETSGANITLERREARSHGIINIFIRGSEDAVRSAVDSLNSIITSQSTIEIRVPEEAKSSLIGQRGAVISKMQKQTGANISVQDGKAVVRGTDSQVTLAKEAILEALARFEKENVFLLLVPSSIGTLIGKGGATLRRLREETGAQIEVNMGDSKNRDNNAQKKTDEFGTIVQVSTVKIRGEQHALDAAVSAVKSLMHGSIVDEAERYSYREQSVAIPAVDATRKLVGKSGETIKGIEDRYGVKVVVERDSSKVNIRGKAGEGILEATRVVRELLENGVHSKEKVTNISKRVVSKLNDPVCLRRVQDETGTLVKLVLASEADDTQSYKKNNGEDQWVVLLEGPAAGVRVVKELLGEFDQGIERDFLKVANAHIDTLKGDGWTNIERLEKKHGVTITLDENRQLVKVKGSPQDLSQAKTGVVHLLRFFFPAQVVTVALESSIVISLVIGKRGTVIRQIQENYDVNVNIDRVNISVDVIGGDASKVEQARSVIQNIVDTWKRENASIEIPREAIATIIGKKGSTIQYIKAESGLEHIDVDRERGMLRMRGETGAIEIATQLVREKIEQFERENDAMTVGYDEVAWVIGPNGVTIQQIQETSGANLYIEKDSNVIYFQGSENAIYAATSEIQRVISQQREIKEQKKREEQERRNAETEEVRVKEEEEIKREILEQQNRKEMEELQSQLPPRELELGQEMKQLLGAPPMEGSFTLPTFDPSPDDQFSYLNRLNLGTGVEMDPAGARHDSLQQTQQQQQHSPMSKGVVGHMGGSDVMGILMGATGDPIEPSAVPPPPMFSSFLNPVPSGQPDPFAMPLPPVYQQQQLPQTAFFQPHTSGFNLAPFAQEQCQTHDDEGSNPYYRA